MHTNINSNEHLFKSSVTNTYIESYIERYIIKNINVVAKKFIGKCKFYTSISFHRLMISDGINLKKKLCDKKIVIIENL